jgi:Domain of unknown function (DUF222)
LELLEREITQLAAHIHAATCRWLGLIAEFDRRHGWASWGCKSCAHWLSYTCAMGSGAAREHVRVARRLQELPAIRAAFERGRTGGERYQVVVHVDLDTLCGHEDGERAPACRLEDGEALDAETARRLACDAGVVSILERGGRPLSAGRKTRSVPPALRRAPASRDQAAASPAAGRPTSCTPTTSSTGPREGERSSPTSCTSALTTTGSSTRATA